VLAGLKRVADDWNALSVDEAPVSLWMRSDPEDASDDTTEAVRICRKGQELNPKRVIEGDRNPSHAIHFSLSCPDGGLPEVDLSVFGTPSGVSDDGVVSRKGPQDSGKESQECLVFANPNHLVRFGEFRQELTMRDERSDGIYHAYIFVKITRISATLFVVFADDGHEITTLEERSIDLVLENSVLLEDWRKHGGAKVHLMRLGQVARPEFLTEPPVLRRGRARSHVSSIPEVSPVPGPQPGEIGRSRPAKKLRKTSPHFSRHPRWQLPPAEEVESDS